MSAQSVVVLAGGVGGAKLADGLAAVTEALTVVVNTADDAEIYGLTICPDLDTVMYTLAGIANPVTGWGVADETHGALAAMARYGVDTWFTLGDKDLATHLVRTERLRRGVPLSQVTAELAAGLGVQARLLPMSDDRVATVVETPAGHLPFQEYFVARHHADTVLGVTFDGVAEARPAPGVLDAIQRADVVVLAPSNPVVSLGPLLAVPGIRDALATTRARRIGVSPIVGGAALKGPAASMLADLGHEVSPVGVARLHEGLLDVFCLDHQDAAYGPAVEQLGMTALVTHAVMTDAPDRERLARELLGAATRPSAGVASA